MQPGRFTTVGGNLTFHIADRRPNGLLVGIFLDDRRDPKEHATYLAEQGEIVKNDTGSFLVLENGSVQRLEAGQRDPRIVTFDRYAFDLSKFTGGPQNVVYNAREKYIWELLWPQPGRSALRGADRPSIDRNCMIALRRPLYPLAFVILAYAFLGPPQTTRQSRTLALLGLVGAVSLLRVDRLSQRHRRRTRAQRSRRAISSRWSASIVAGLWQISRGQALEPAAAVSKIATADQRTLRASDGELRSLRCSPAPFRAISDCGFSVPSSPRSSAWSRWRR